MYTHTKAHISPRGPVHSPNEDTEGGRVDETHVNHSHTHAGTRALVGGGG